MDEYMNLVIDAAEELSMKKETRKALGTSALKCPTQFCTSHVLQ